MRRWHYWSLRLAREIARDTETFAEAIAYLDERMGEDLLIKVAEDVQGIAPGIEGDEVLRLWTERQGGRYRHSSYGIGTWLLGEDRALATLEEEDEEDTRPEPEAGTQAAARKELEERIRRYLKNQELVRQTKSGGGQSGSEEPEEMWSRWNHSGRSRWILSYFVESSGHFEAGPDPLLGLPRVRGAGDARGDVHGQRDGGRGAGGAAVAV